MNTRGFTLVETVVIVAMYIVILVALANLFATFSRLYRLQQSLIGTSQAAGASIAAIQAAVQPAGQVLASHAFSTGTRASGATTLVLELPAVDASGQVILGSSDYVAFFASSTSLYRLSEPAAGSARLPGTRLLTPFLGSISFSYDNADFTKVTRVTVDLVASTTVNGTPMSTHRDETFYLRNLP